MRILLFCRLPHSKPLAQYRQSGFTLIELLLIVVMIGVISIAAINAFDGNEEQARENITRLEMAELQKALLQFRRDNRELPCTVYRQGAFNPFDLRNNYGDEDFIDIFVLPAGGASLLDWQGWCLAALSNGSKTLASNGLYMLNAFPYKYDEPELVALTWNRNTQLGWNGPYISQEGLTDGWGNRYVLMEPELSYDSTYRCQDNAGDYAINGDGEYICLPPNDPGFNISTDILPADIARIVSAGPDGVIDSLLTDYSLPADDPCIAQNDDFVLCLLR